MCERRGSMPCVRGRHEEAADLVTGRSPVHALEKVKCADDPAHLLKDDDCASATTVTE